MTTFRIERLNREFQREISLLLRSRVKNEDAHRAIITHVSCSKDLSHAKVYFTVVSQGEISRAEAALEEVGGLLRSILGKEMRLRKIPELHFMYDDTQDKARAIESVLDAIKEHGSDSPG